MGVVIVDRIPDEWRPIRKLGPDQWVAKRGAKKRLGDFWCLCQGFALLVECKRSRSTLPYSALRPHQVVALDRVDQLGHLSALWWQEVATGRCWLLPWRSTGLAPRRSVSVAVAERIAIRSLDDMSRAWNNSDRRGD